MDIKQLDREYIMPTYGRFDLCITSGKGSTLLDENGKEYQVVRILDPQVFMQVRDTRRTVRNKRLYLAEYKKYVEQTVVYDLEGNMIISIMRDVTDEEGERQKKESISQHTIEIADKVVEKQMRIVQEIASLLGETAAETKIALTKLKESIIDE